MFLKCLNFEVYQFVGFSSAIDLLFVVLFLLLSSSRWAAASCEQFLLMIKIFFSCFIIWTHNIRGRFVYWAHSLAPEQFGEQQIQKKLEFGEVYAISCRVACTVKWVCFFRFSGNIRESIFHLSLFVYPHGLSLSRSLFYSYFFAFAFSWRFLCLHFTFEWVKWVFRFVFVYYVLCFNELHLQSTSCSSKRFFICFS